MVSVATAEKGRVVLSPLDCPVFDRCQLFADELLQVQAELDR